MPTNLANIAAFKPEQHSIEECLLELEKYGCPHITKAAGDRSYWWSGIDVFVTGEVVCFSIKYSPAKTPKEAINGVYQRLIDAMDKIKET